MTVGDGVGVAVGIAVAVAVGVGVESPSSPKLIPLLVSAKVQVHLAKTRVPIANAIGLNNLFIFPSLGMWASAFAVLLGGKDKSGLSKYNNGQLYPERPDLEGRNLCFVKVLFG